ncbi:rod shape-determining protein [Streptacidiphilus melanogenes]|uniref:rod shape-determining protein n=1 Tax=Streptacidiphilus melanogenes TaxID=411235 RepID=UPI0005A6508F|nr:rod shape-determining protein [Streptacidiphilus melanogenes]
MSNAVSRAVADRLIALDLGTSRVRVWRPRQGVVFDEPSVVAYDLNRGVAFAFGENAQKMTGRTPPGMDTVSPIHAGAVTDFEAARVLARHAIDTARPSRFALRPSVATAVPVESHGIHLKALEQAVVQAGAARTVTVPAPLAAAVGAGIEIGRESGSMVVDLGAGTTDMAVFAFGRIVSATSLPVAGLALDRALTSWARRSRRIDLGPVAAEQLRIAAGHPEADSVEVKGRRTEFGTPVLARFTAAEVHAAVLPVVEAIVQGMGGLLTRCPTELSADITDHGLVLTGGGARDLWLCAQLERRLGLPVQAADSPENCTAKGLGELAMSARGSGHVDALSPV